MSKLMSSHKIQMLVKSVVYAEAWAMREALTTKKEEKQGEEKDFIYFPSKKENVIRRRVVA